MASSNAQRAPRKKAAKKAHVQSGKVYIQASFNNTLVYITDGEGNVLGWDSAGKQGFKGSRKSTPYAAQVAAKSACQKVKDMIPGLRHVEIFIKGPGPGREISARAVSEFFKVTSITEATGIPHNGCRDSKGRRV